MSRGQSEAIRGHQKRTRLDDALGVVACVLQVIGVRDPDHVAEFVSPARAVVVPVEVLGFFEDHDVPILFRDACNDIVGRLNNRAERGRVERGVPDEGGNQSAISRNQLQFVAIRMQ